LFTPKPWLTLGVLALALLPHLQWLRAHDYVTLHYVSEQGNANGTDWQQLLKFALAPMAYWLLPWLLATWLCGHAETSAAQTLRGWPKRMWQSWRPTGWHDTLLWFAMWPWLITLGFGISGFVELSLPWAIPIGYGFSLLWLRNLHVNAQQTQQVTALLLKCLKGWWILVVLISPWYAWQQAQDGTENHYLPRREAATALQQAWQTRYPNVPLAWVGGQWAESALMRFYGDHQLQVVPEVPDQFPATVNPLPQWEKQAGLLLCPMGPIHAPHGSDCPERMRRWLTPPGQSAEAIEVTVRSHGMRFPREMPFRYVAFAYLPPPLKSRD
jgi:hypothetical protein